MNDAEQTEALRVELANLSDALRRCELRSAGGRYASAVVHEINNPLEALANLVYLTQHQSDSPENVRENMEQAEKLILQMSHVAHQALSFSREKREFRKVDLVDSVRWVLKMHSGRVSAQHVAVSFVAGDPVYVEAIPPEIFQVLSNLVLNALDAVPDNTGSLLVRIRQTSDYIHVTVADNGCGINPEIRRLLFTPHNTSKRSGTGLGLWLSQDIMNRHRGTIRCRSSVRHGSSGTVFRIGLPAWNP